MSEQYGDPRLKIFALNSNKPLAEKIAAEVGVKLGKSSVKRFSDGEFKSTSKKVFVGMMFISSNPLPARLTTT